jgi:hypothetical protein
MSVTGNNSYPRNSKITINCGYGQMEWNSIEYNRIEQNRKKNRLQKNTIEQITSGQAAWQPLHLDHIQSPMQPFAYAFSSPLLIKMSAKSPGCKK